MSGSDREFRPVVTCGFDGPGRVRGGDGDGGANGECMMNPQADPPGEPASFAFDAASEAGD